MLRAGTHSSIRDQMFSFFLLFFLLFSLRFHISFQNRKKNPATVLAKRLTTGLEETVLKDVFKAWKKHEYAWFKFSRIG